MTAGSLALAGLATATSPGTNGSIAFVRGGDVWAIDSDGGNERQLTSTPEPEQAPAWSPDGSTIAFSRGLLSPRVVADDGFAPADVWIARADGSGPRRITTGALPETEPSFAPDGRRLAVARRGVFLCESNDEVVVVDLVTGLERSLASGGARQPAWSPTGGRVAFTLDPGCNDPADLRLVPESGGVAAPFPDAPPLLQSVDADDRPSWSPDGTRVAYRSAREECVPVGERGQVECLAVGGVAVKPADVPAPRQVLAPEAADPAFSPDGRLLAYVRARELLVRDLATGAERRLTGDAAEPAWQVEPPAVGVGTTATPPAAAAAPARTAPLRRVVRLHGVPRVRRVGSADRARLAWRAHPGATAYRVALFRGTRRVFTRVTVRPRTPLPARLRPGAYRLVVWHARGRAGARRFSARPLLSQRLDVRIATAS